MPDFLITAPFHAKRTARARRTPFGNPRHSVLLVLVLLLLLFSGPKANALNEEAVKHYQKACELGKRGENQEARRELQKASSLEPGWKEPYKLLGDIYEQQRMPREAWELYRKALGLDPKDFDAWCKTAAAYRELGDKENSLNTYREILRRFPQSSTVHKNISEILQEQGKTKEALEEFRKGPFDRKNQDDWIALIALTAASGDRSGATELSNEAAKLFPENPRLGDLKRLCRDGSFSGVAAGVSRLSTVNAAAFPSTKAAITAQNTDLSSLPDEDSFSFRKAEYGHLMTMAEVNGQSIEMIFDTGANYCSIGTNHLQSLGIDPDALSGKNELVGGSGGRAVNAKIVGLNLKLGKTVRKVDFFVIKNMPTPPLVGQNFLNGLQYEVNNQLQLVKLKKQSLDQKAQKQKGLDPRDRNEVPFVMMGQNIVVPVEVCGQQVDMIFDTGCTGIVFPAAMWSKLKLNAKLLGVGASSGIDGVSKCYYFNVDRIDFGPVSLKDVQVSVSNPGPYMPLLGQSVLGGEKFIIDDNSRVIRFHR